MSTASCYALKHRPAASRSPRRGRRRSRRGTRCSPTSPLDRVRDGVERIRWWKGEAVGVDRVFSDRLLLGLLAATDPERRRADAAARARTVAAAAGAAPGAALAGPAGVGDGALGTAAGTAPGTAAVPLSYRDGVTDDAGDGAAEGFDPDAEGRLSPEDAAMTAAFLARLDAAKAATAAQADAIGAALDAALGRTPAGRADD